VGAFGCQLKYVFAVPTEEPGQRASQQAKGLASRLCRMNSLKAVPQALNQLQHVAAKARLTASPSGQATKSDRLSHKTVTSS
jgi:hypothetical protein